jgi:glycosyltransferase involved in cell wall biosynthesis
MLRWGSHAAASRFGGGVGLMPTPSGVPAVSVVIPVYNTAPYLAQCLDSVLAQSLGEWDCVVLDNQSTDGSLEIARDYEQRDPRIRVVAADQFRPQAANFNHALGFIHPESRYVKMVLSDDWIFPSCLEQMVRVGEANPRIGLIGAFMIAGTNVGCRGLPYPSEVVSGRELMRQHFLSGVEVFGTQTTVMYRGEVVRAMRPFFDEQSPSNDREVCFRILPDWDFGFVHQVLTYTRTDNESITTGIVGFNPYGLHSLVLLKQYGPQVLNPHEYRRSFDRLASPYFAFLGESALRGREPAFWAYHARGLERIGYPLTTALKFRLALRTLLDLLGNPKASAERLAKFVARRWGKGSRKDRRANAWGR